MIKQRIEVLFVIAILAMASHQAKASSYLGNKLLSRSQIAGGVKIPSDTAGVDSNFHIFLLIGQSNMAGRAPLDSSSRETNPNILMLDKENHWVIAKNPLHFDKRKIAGVGPGLSFAREMLRHAPKGTRIGLVPAAWGGSPIRVWQPDSVYLRHKPYDEAVERTLVAMKSGVLSGILWHQGEADNRAAKSRIYMTYLQKLVGRLRQAFGNDQLPFVAGEVGYFKTIDFINPVLDSIAYKIPYSLIVSAEGLTDKGDRTHFDTRSARILGKRYAIKMHELLEKSSKMVSQK